MRRSREKFLVDFESLAVEADEFDDGDAAGIDMLANGIDGDASCALGREVVRAGADGWKCDGSYAVLLGEFEATSVAIGEEFIFVTVASMPDRANGVKDPFGGKTEAGSCLRVSSGAAMKSAAFGEEFRAGCIVDRAINSASPEQRGIGCIHDGIDGLLRDVSLNGDEFGHFQISGFDDTGRVTEGCFSVRWMPGGGTFAQGQGQGV